MANGAGAQVDELRREEHHHREKEGNDSALLRPWVTVAHSTLLRLLSQGLKRKSWAETQFSPANTLGGDSIFPSKSLNWSVSPLAVSRTDPDQSFTYHRPSLLSSSQFLILVPALCRSY